MSYSPTKTNPASARTANSTAAWPRRWSAALGLTYPEPVKELPNKNALRAKRVRDARREAGLCYRCGAPSIDGWRCEAHKLAERERRRRAYRLTHGIDLEAPITSGRPRKYKTLANGVSTL